MAPIKVAVWSAVVEPGKELAIVVPKDFTLTNAALGEDLADPKGRSVLKLTHIVIPDKYLRTPDDYSDLEDEEDEEEEDDEDDEDPEASFEDTTTVLTSLTAGRTEQSQLNLTFNERDELIFTVSGSNIVHLSGNYIDQAPDEDDSDMDQDPDSDDYDSDMDPEDFAGEDEDESMDDEELAGKITEVPEPTNGKRSAETSTEELSKSQKKKLNKKLKGESGEAAPAPAVEEKKAAAAPAPKAAVAGAAPKAEAKSNKKVHGNGLVTEDSKLGTGAVAKSGKKVGMRYIGKLANGKVFDSNTNGKPFVIVLGKGEVIKGWDLGVAGMAIGGERKLTIPAPLAYGSKALPGIPKNSTLHFEVKLVSVQ